MRNFSSEQHSQGYGFELAKVIDPDLDFWHMILLKAAIIVLPAKSPGFDPIDLKILRELQKDARLPNDVLAERVGLSPSPCSRRVKLLEEAGAIEGYRTIISRSAIGLGLTVFAGIRVGRHSAERKDKFIEPLLAMPEVIACHLGRRRPSHRSPSSATWRHCRV
jgi:hypothetical protein